MQTLKFILSAFVLALLALPACETGGRRDSRGQNVTVFVSILPLSFFVHRIAADYADVEVLVGPGQSPETFEPTSKQMARIAGAKAFFTIGVPFEEVLLPRIRNVYPSIKIVDSRTGITLRDPDGEPGSHEYDPHVWLDPRHAKTITKNVYEAFAGLDPVRADTYRRNCEELLAELDDLDAEIALMLAPLRGTTLLVYHPALGYFADRYGLKQVAIEKGGVAPGPKHIAGLLEGTGATRVRAIFVQPQFSRSAAETIAERTGAKIYTVDPLSADYISNLRELARTIRAACAND